MILGVSTQWKIRALWICGGIEDKERERERGGER